MCVNDVLHVCIYNYIRKVPDDDGELEDGRWLVGRDLANLDICF